MENLRPGVSTSYTLQYSRAAESERLVGIAADAGGTLLKTRVQSAQEAKSVCGGRMLALCEALFQVVQGTVLLADTGEDAGEAVDVLLAGGATLLVLEDASLSFLQAVGEKLRAAAATGVRAMAVVGCETAQEALTAAQVQEMRLCVAAPAVRDAAGNLRVEAALTAGLIAQSGGDAVKLCGAQSPEGFSTTALAESMVQNLLQNGVCVLEPCGGTVSLIRGVTAQTTDAAFRNVGAVLAFDTVLSVLEQKLQERMQEGMAQTDAVTALLVNELEKQVEEGRLTAYDTPVVTRDLADPSVCTVTVGFTLAQSVNRIWLHAVVQG